MANDVLSVLHLDKESLCNKVIVIGECQDTDTIFFHCSLIAKQLKDKGAVCFVNFHNDSEFYNKVCRKMGYNLSDLLETGSLKFIDCVSHINDSLRGIEDATINFLKDPNALDKLFSIIELSVLELITNHSSVLILIDDLTHLFDLNYNANSINLFYQRCKCLVFKHPQCSLEVGVHIVSEYHQSNILYNAISHMSTISCKTTSLKTGRSLEVTGNLSIAKSSSDQCINMQNYHYKLYDRGIKVFAPGSK